MDAPEEVVPQPVAVASLPEKSALRGGMHTGLTPGQLVKLTLSLMCTRAMSLSSCEETSGQERCRKDRTNLIISQ